MPFHPPGVARAVQLPPAAGAQRLAISPTDGTLPLPGHWRWASARHFTFDDPSQQGCHLEMLELTANALKVNVLQP